MYCYQKRSYTELIERSFDTQYLCPKIFNVRYKVWCSGRFQRLNKAEKSKIFDNINITVGYQLDNLRPGYLKTATLKAAILN